MSDLDRIWADFLVYIERAPAANYPGVLFAGFRDELIAQGWSKEKASETIRTVVSMAATRRDWTAPMFDRIYASPDPGFNLRPNDLLVEVAAGRVPGTALDIAMGQGRNALYLASQGWAVSGFDVSSEGIAVALQEAARSGMSIDAKVLAHDDFDYGVASWDLIVMTYALVPVTDEKYATTLVDSLLPGGVMVIESFGPEMDRPARPVEIDPDRLREAYAQLEVIRFEDSIATGDWTDEPSRIVRMAAVKP